MEKSILPGNVVRYPILRLGDPYKADRDILSHFLFESIGCAYDRMKVKDYNESLAHCV